MFTLELRNAAGEIVTQTTCPPFQPTIDQVNRVKVNPLVIGAPAIEGGDPVTLGFPDVVAWGMRTFTLAEVNEAEARGVYVECFAYRIP
jgi:hypothetical protein